MRLHPSPGQRFQHAHAKDGPARARNAYDDALSHMLSRPQYGKSGTIASMKSFSLVLLAATLALPLLAQDAPRKPSAVLQEACGACHGLNRLDTSRNRSEWKDTVERMVANGADVKANEMESLIGFITRFYGETIDINKASAQQIQEELDMTPAEAEMIVKARGANGAFKAYDDVKKSGVDAKRLDPIKDRLKYN
jgi:hypothetical protein